MGSFKLKKSQSEKLDRDLATIRKRQKERERSAPIPTPHAVADVEEPAPYGFEIHTIQVPYEGALIPVKRYRRCDEEMSNIERIDALRSGRGSRTIAAHLNGEGRTWRGESWTKDLVLDVLRRIK